MSSHEAEQITLSPGVHFQSYRINVHGELVLVGPNLDLLEKTIGHVATGPPDPDQSGREPEGVDVGLDEILGESDDAE